jgi:Ca2+-binding RTX toxin-like protein
MNNGLWRIGGTGDDTIDLGLQAFWDIRDNADGGDGNDTIWGNIADNHITGGNGNDYITGSWGNDHIEGGNGNDSLFGQEDNDHLEGGAGGDLLDGGSGNDLLEGGSGTDNLYGGDGDDTVEGDTGNDVLHGDNGDDNLIGGDGQDSLYGGSGNDILQGDEMPSAFNSTSNDYLSGGDGNDYLIGMQGNDVMYGDAGNDTIYDGYIDNTGNDSMYGGDGNDDLHSFDGADYLSGGAGDDNIYISDAGARLGTPGLEMHGGSGYDTLHLDFEAKSTTVISGLPNAMDGFQRVDIEDAANTDWTLSFRDIRTMSDTDHITFDGDTGDVLRLENNVAGDSLSGGTWVQGLTEITADPSESFTHYDYTVHGTVAASVSVDTDIHVFLI